MSALNFNRFERIKEAHIRRHREMFRRSVLELETGDAHLESLPTDERLKRIADGGTDTKMAELYYAYGRYLLMSCSQPGGLPANLQGIWCEKLEPIWDSKYTININTQMNYWPAEICNLSECHLPLFDHLERMLENGKQTAREMYGCRGFVAHHNTDVWADTAPQDLAIPASYWGICGIHGPRGDGRRMARNPYLAALPIYPGSEISGKNVSDSLRMRPVFCRFSDRGQAGTGHLPVCLTGKHVYHGKRENREALHEFRYGYGDSQGYFDAVSGK